MTGDTAGAIAAYHGLAGDRAVLPAALAWRYGAAVYMWGDPRDALGVLRRGQVADDDTVDSHTADEALLLAWTAAAYWLAGDAAACADACPAGPAGSGGRR